MKKVLHTTWIAIFSDRQLLTLLAIILSMTVLYSVYVAFSASPTELQIATRYTAFGETQFYRSKWYALLMFIGFALVISGTHIALILKLKLREMRPIAIGLAWLTIILLIILTVLTRSVLNVAYLT